MIQRGRVNIMIGGQWGSEGKGKLAGILYENHPEIDTVIVDFNPNAGHTWVADGGTKKFVSKIIPIGAVFPSVRHVIIGPHSVFDVSRFFEELRQVNDLRNSVSIDYWIHPHAVVLKPEHAEKERSMLKHIASTMQGSAAAYQEKVMRIPGASLARDVQDLLACGFVHDTHEWLWNNMRNVTVLCESAQGFDLSLNTGHRWPYVTGRDCMLGRLMDNAGISPKYMGKVIAALRTFPIRVGSLPEGSSGPRHDDHLETSWDAVSKELGQEVIEYTTVTKRVRRVFTWSDNQVRRFLKCVRPDFAFLNYVNYYNDWDKNYFVPHIRALLSQHSCMLSILGTGPEQGQYEFTDEYLRHCSEKMDSKLSTKVVDSIKSVDFSGFSEV
jgi:adenylosuccinate synthase